MTARLIMEPKRVEGDRLELAATFEQGGKSGRLWWRLPASWESTTTDWVDAFVVGMIFPIMQAGEDVVVEGKVSPSLLANLELYMAIWARWAPERYKIVGIRALQEIEPPVHDGPEEWVTPFSAGIDSCFTLYRHHTGMIGRRRKLIGGGVIIDGFDIHRREPNAAKRYETVLTHAQAMTASLGVPCIPIATNFRELPTLWEHSHASQLVSGMMLFSGRFGGMLIPNSTSYREFDVIWGSHPLSDPLLGSAHFPVVDDGAECSRQDKCEVVSRWPTALEHVKVCFGAAWNADNCGVCEKCIRTILGFRIAGADLPKAFAQDVTDRQIQRTALRADLNLSYWEALEQAAKKHGVAETSWGRAISKAISREHRRSRFAAFKSRFIPLRNAIRRVFRGPPKNQTESAGVGLGIPSKLE